ncbi:Hypothetical protein [Corynebacterium glutamicum ATCC 13032]|uniref:Uncharacterized protein n=1 Tax=Corynebacterium glutamicum (strain ATCC 13032 / DSM 20300 / JCM 1318 / BCRC 11384 / CCUG 27702 / LMG 3730 / NBRC 12168 / NCIMB 10025 / NRRL B-2784 / 534) TaxID=196627 RepID=Q8NNY0_CORGL|nr:Hypothetical protein [Corynebacterium glutamicum ATCC 13032]
MESYPQRYDDRYSWSRKVGKLTPAPRGVLSAQI